MKTNRNLKTFVAKLGLACAFLMTATGAYAQFYQPEWSSVELDECDGEVRAKFRVFDEGTTGLFYSGTFHYTGDDAQYGADFQIKSGDGQWTTIASYKLMRLSIPTSEGYTDSGVSSTHLPTFADQPQKLVFKSVNPNYFTTLINAEVNQDNDGSVALLVYIIDLEDHVNEELQFRLKNEYWSGNPIFGTATFDDVTIPGYDPVGNFMVLDNNGNCDGVQLDWTEPEGLCQNVDVVIERKVVGSGSDFEEIDRVAHYIFSYIDDTAIPGEEYEYRARFSSQLAPITPEGESYNDGPLSAIVTGMRKAPPEPPPGFSVSTNNCTEKVALTWNFITGTDSLEIFRDGESVGMVAGSVTNFEDPVPESDTGFSYTIRAKNDCGWGELSASLTGVSPGLPYGSDNLTAEVVPGAGIELNWIPVQNVTGYKIERSQLGGGGASYFEVPSGATSYLDESLVACQTYEYRIRSVNSCAPNGVASDSVRTASLVPDLLTTFSPDALEGSKGYYPNRVEVAWAAQNNGSIINAYKIYRKQLGSDADSLQIASVNSGNNLYIDNFADAGTLYEYTIVGETQCENATLYSNPAQSVGFRRPFGTVNGNATYSGGIAVEGVRISAETTSQIFGKSAEMDGNATISIPHKNNLNPDSEFLLEAWIRPTSLTETDILFQKGNTYRAQYDAATAALEITVTANDGQTYTLAHATPELTENNFNHVAFQLYQDSLQIFLNGSKLASQFTAPDVELQDSPLPIELGAGFQGQLDEVRIWNAGKDSLNMARDHGRLMLGGEQGLVAYLRMDEGAGNYAYDVSRDGNIFNRNHGSFAGNIAFSPNIPSVNQLGIAAYTDAQGNYTLLVPYNGGGESFVLTPSFLTHQFNPSTQAIFVGDGSSVYNNIDFIDISSFTVTGHVFYDSTSCPAKGVGLFVDGVPVIFDGQPVETGSDGSFEIEVPIGLHHVSVEKANHEFSVGRFPADGKYNFQDDLVLGEFKDATLVKIVGRVVGGLREANKIPGLGKSRNNIGMAELSFISQAGNGCATGTAQTDSLTGEYLIQLPPLSYITTVSMNNPQGIDFGDAQLVDLTNSTQTHTEYDTLYNSLGDPYQVDSVQYNKRLDYIYRVNPVIDVKSIDGVSPFIGDSIYTYVDEATGTSFTRNLVEDPMRWPVFANAEDDHLYRCMIWIYEPYYNNDSGDPQLDKVPTGDGQLIITNELAAVQNASLELADLNEPDSLVAIVYSFPLGAPSFVEDITYPDYSYSRRFEITLLTADNQTIHWNPGPDFSGYGDGKYRGYVLAGVTLGNQFVTEGPEVPDYVLRDPPGSGSFSTREVGTTRTTQNQWSWSEGKWSHAEDMVYLGVDISTGLGVSVNTEVEANLGLGLEAHTTGGRSGTMHTEVTNTMEWKTNEGTDMPGAPSDLYIGKTQNVEFGLAQHLALVPDSLCETVECLQLFDNGFALAKTHGLSVKDGGYSTSFIYSQGHILNYEIPTLTNLRNIALQSDARYQSHLPLSDPNYGRNNDDPVFGDDVSTDTPDHGEYADFSGMSYTYAPETLADSIRDIVRFANNQIRQWQNAIRLNEWEKVNIKNQSAIDSLKTLELERLETKYAESIEAFNDYVSSNDTSGIVMYTLAAIPIFGNATVGNALFAKTSESSLEFALLLEDHYAYTQAKERIEDRFNSIAGTNFSISGGSAFTSSMGQSTGHGTTNSYDIELTADAIFEIKATVSNNGLGNEGNIGTTMTTGRDWTTSGDSSETVSFTLFDPDQGDQMSVDVYPSILGWGPIFYKQDGGRTACPHEGQLLTQFYNPGTVISGTSQQVDKPAIAVSPAIITNTPVDQPAVFNLTLINESESNAQRNYDIQLVSSSNPFGAIAKIDGLTPVTSAVIPGGAAINKVLTIEKGPGPVYDYDSLLFVISAPCQYDGQTTDNIGIADSVYVSARFTPACTEVALLTPELQWVANNFNENTVPAILSGYNINYFDLEHLNFQYKPSNESQWITLETFYQDTAGFNDTTLLPIANSSPVTLYDWHIDQLTDGYYDVRLKSQCTLADNTSVIHSGIIDRINPHPFGTPSPADGILSPNDELSIRFNEAIEAGSLTAQNFDVRGVLNGTETGHASSLFFDGVDDYVEVTGGIALTNRDFSIQMAVKPAGSGERTLFAQGVDPGEQLYLGLTADNQIAFRINDQEVVSNGAPLANDTWHYIGLAYDFENETAEIFYANESGSGMINTGNTAIFPNYQGGGRVWMGKRGHGDAAWYHGKMHEVRVWDRTLSFSEFNSSMNRILGRGTDGLLYNWRMDELEGTESIDHVRRRDAQVVGPTWSVEPGGSAATFDGMANHLKISSGDVAITQAMDFTLEFWFRGDGNNPGVLFSNGKADGLGSDSLYSWKLYKDGAGLLHLENNGNDFLLSENNYFDGNWHHLAIVMNRSANLSAIVDGNPQLATQAGPFRQLAGPAMYLGAHGYLTGTVETVENHFHGELDEFRFWNSARKLEQINRDKRNRMRGDEPSLRIYLPFENYETDPTGVPILTPAFNEQINPELHAVSENGTVLIDETPTISIRRPVEAVAFAWSVNGDEIIFTTTTDQAMIENVTLDVTVSNVRDLQGNVMSSPETWIAYIDKNQVVWGDDVLEFEQAAGEPLTFSSQVINHGGAAKAFTLENLPNWLSASPTSGTVPPDAEIEIDFSVDPLTNIGDYTQDIQLLTDFGFPEKLTIDLKVRETPPDWNVNPSEWSHSMGIVGLLKIKDIVSVDEEDILAAFAGGELRGVQHVEYLEAIDRYLVFMDVYGDAGSGEELNFKIWDAGSGILYSEVTPQGLQYTANALLGSALEPIVFNTNYQIETELPLDAGYNWISQYLLNADSANFDLLLGNLHSETGDQINGQTDFADFQTGAGWNGPLENSGLRPEMLVKLFTSDADTLVMRGDVIDPTTRPITLLEGWNWIGYISVRNQGIAQALGNLDPVDGDLIKGRSQFAVYTNPVLGWQGTLQTLVPGRGYMYRSGQNTSFTFPFAGMFKQGPTGSPDGVDGRWKPNYGAFPTNMNLIVQAPDSCAEAVGGQNLLVGAFDAAGGVRGLAGLAKSEKAPLAFLTAGGEPGEVLELRWINSESGMVWDATGQMQYRGNELVGSFFEPYILALPSELCPRSPTHKNKKFSVHPTLFQQRLTVEFRSDTDHGEGLLRIADMEGRELFSRQVAVNRGWNRWSPGLPEHLFAPGPYLISLIHNGGVHTEKIFKTN